MIRVRLLAGGLLVLCAAACGTPAPPPVALRAPALDSDEIAVLTGVLDDVIRPERLVAMRQDTSARPVEPRFLVVDTTLAVCPRDRMARATPPGGCIGPDWLAFVSRVLPNAVLLFESRNARRLPIPGSLGPSVTFISATVTDFVDSDALLRQHPPGSAIVSFSAPVYPDATTAVVAYRVRHRRSVIAAARLRRQSDGRWTLIPDGMRGGIEGTEN